MTRRRLLMTGGSGRLGTALAATDLSRSYEATFLSSGDVDVRDPGSVAHAVTAHAPDVILHAAAWTDVRGAETQRDECWSLNVGGTRHVVRAAREAGARLIHVSTDYVFWGGDDRPEGGYREEDVPGPVRNYYSLTKLVAEEAVRGTERALVLRTSFRPSEWPYPQAFDDVFTSQDYVDVIAAEIALLLAHLDQVDVATLHVVTERKSIHELARRRNPHVRPGSKRDAGVDLPDDITLNADRWRALKRDWT